jgi:uncharacterized membrane protein YjjP (DUF1212 family)
VNDAAPAAASGTAPLSASGPRGGEEVAVAFLARLGRALHRYGTPADRLEESLARAATALGIDGQFFSAPTELLIAVGGPAAQRTSLLRVEPGEVDLGRLERLDLVANDVIGGRISVEEGSARLDRLLAAPPRWSAAVVLLADVAAAGSMAALLGGRVRDVVAASLAGVGVGTLRAGVVRWPGFGRVEPVLAAFFAAVIAGTLARLAPGLAVGTVTLAALLSHLPGLSLTVAMIELATGNLASGTVRVAGALLVLLELAIGVALGSRVALAIQLPSAPSLPSWFSVAWPVTEPLTLLLTSSSLLVVTKARLRDLPVVLVAGAVAVYGARMGELWLGTELGAFVGAFLLSAASNAYARMLDRPALTPLVPGIITLVPGSMGFRSISALMDQDVQAGVSVGFSMLVVAASLAVGVLFGQGVVPPRRAL